MATFRAGKLARKKNGRFKSTAVKSKTGNFFRLLQNKKSSETALSGRRVDEGSSLVCFLFSPKRGW